MELLGDALTQLKTIEPDSIDMMITSPPYYGLRNYGTDPVIWGGNKNCQHQWGETLKYSGGTYNNAGSDGTFDRPYRAILRERFKKSNSGQFCQLCGAWIGELGSEPTVQLFITHLLEIFAEVYRVLKPEGTCFVNIADTYNSSQAGNKNSLCGQQQKYGEEAINSIMKYERHKQNMPSKSQLCVPERLVLGMIDQGWIKRNTIIWHKPSCLPSSAKDRFTIDFEHLFFFVKSEKYYFEQQFEPYSGVYLDDSRHGKDLSHYNEWKPYGEAGVQGGCITRNKIFNSGINPKGRNKRAVWDINPAHNKEAHFATFPEELIKTPILAGCPEGGIVLDPFGGTFTTAVVAYKHHRNWLMIEPNPEYFEMGSKRLRKHTDQERIF